MTSDRTDTTAAVTQKTQAQVCTKLSILFKQHLWELHTQANNTLLHKYIYIFCLYLLILYSVSANMYTTIKNKTHIHTYFSVH